MRKIALIVSAAALTAFLVVKAQAQVIPSDSAGNQKYYQPNVAVDVQPVIYDTTTLKTAALAPGLMVAVQYKGGSVYTVCVATGAVGGAGTPGDAVFMSTPTATAANPLVPCHN
jgi:hypothetical protein